MTTVSFAQQRDTRRSDDDEDARRPQWLYFVAEAGVARANSNAFLIDEGTRSARFVDQSDAGPMMGLGAGLRLSVVTIGPRARLALLDRYDLVTLGGDIGVRVPISVFEPHVELGGGYAALSGLDDPDSDRRELSADGAYGRVSGGLDVHVTRAVTIGGAASWEAFGVTPDGVSTATVDEVRRQAAAGDRAAAESTVRRAEGAAYGTALSLGLSLGLHY